MRTIRRLAMLAIVLAAALGLAAQVEVVSRTIIMYTAVDPASGFSGSQRQLLIESMILKLSTASPEVKLRFYPGDANYSDAELDQLALLSGGDGWMLVTIAGTMEKMTVGFRARDIQKNQDFFRTTITSALDSRFRNAFGGLWQPIIRLMQDTIHPFRQYNTLVVTAPPGSLLKLAGQAPQVMGPQGEAKFELTAPATYSYTLELGGHHPVAGTIFLESDTVYPIAPVKRAAAAASVGLEWLAYPRLGVSLDLVPDWFEAEIGLVSYQLGLQPTQPTDATINVFHDHGLAVLSAGLRLQFLGHSIPLRLSLGIGGQLRLASQGYLRPDPLLPGGVYASLQASLDLTRDIAVYIDFSPQCNFSPDPILASSALARQRPSPLTGNLLMFAAGPALIEPLHAGIGLRIQP